MTKQLDVDAPLSFQELVTLSLQLNSRLDMLWHRVLYSHAAIVGVMVFFASRAELFAVQRHLVFGFYTINTIITVIAFREVYVGLLAAIEDLKALSGSAQMTNVQRWIFSRNYTRHSIFRATVMGLAWLILGYILIYPIYY